MAVYVACSDLLLNADRIDYVSTQQNGSDYNWVANIQGASFTDDTNYQSAQDALDAFNTAVNPA